MRGSQKNMDAFITIDGAGLKLGNAPLRIQDLDGAAERPLFLTDDVVLISKGVLAWSESTEIQELRLEVIVYDSKGRRREMTDTRGRLSVISAAGLLAAFCRLAEASDEQILEFAESWGVLEFQSRKFPKLSFREKRFANFQGKPIIERRQHTEVYRVLARCARSILVMEACLIQGKEITQKLWKEIEFDSILNGDIKREFPGLLPDLSFERTNELNMDRRQAEDARRIGLDRERLDNAFNMIWLNESGATLYQSRDKQGNVITRLSPGGTLFGELAVQLATARASNVALCSQCGKPYSPKRQPATGAKNICGEEECKKKAHRIIAREAARMKAARKGEAIDDVEKPVASS